MIESVLLILGAALLASAESPRDSLPAPVVTLPAVEVTRERALLDARRRLPTAFVRDLRANASNRALGSANPEKAAVGFPSRRSRGGRLAKPVEGAATNAEFSPPISPISGARNAPSTSSATVLDAR